MKISKRQHLIFIGCVLLLTPLILFSYRQRVVDKESARLTKAMREEQEKVEFLKREINAFQQPDLNAARSSVLDAQSRLRGVKIEGDTSKGRYISNRPTHEVNEFLSLLSRMSAKNGLQLLSHRGLRAANANLGELIIREMKLTGSFSGLARFVSYLGQQTYRVLILQIKLHQPKEGPLEATLVFSL